MIQKIADNIRVLVADIVEKAKSGHPGMPLGTAEIASVLYGEVVKHDPTMPNWPDRDRFILSAGHGSALLYTLLYLTGYSMPLEELKRFRQFGSMTPGHPELGVAPGIETTTGPLGQGLANGVGMALAERILAAKFNRPDFEIINHFTYIIAGDGCMMEGITSEASSLAADLGLGKLVVIYDDNQISIEGNTDLAFKEDVPGRYLAYGWQVIEIDGNNPEKVLAAFEKAKTNITKPTLIVAKTVIAKGSPLAGNPEAHGAPLGQENIAALKRNLGFPETDFYVAPEVLEYFAHMRLQWQQQRELWEDKFEKWSDHYPELRSDWDRITERKLPVNLVELLPTFEIGAKIATRDAGGKILNQLAAYLPELIGGSADLSPSTKTYLKEFSDISAVNFEGRNLHFGVREHAMGGIMNGISVHGGFRVFGSTFLVFVDYMRPAVRLAALMRQPVIYVFTHDSFYVGEDGPTHQPVEQIESLRIIPGMHVIRPADANETGWAWLSALERTNGPTALILTRQKLPTLASTSKAGFERGGYIVQEVNGKTPDIIILASGSEVNLAVKAGDLLAKEGKFARVISVPCREILLEQDPEYLNQILGSGIPRVAIEAGIGSGWSQLVGSSGLIIALNRFGTSGPFEELEKEFGFTPEAVAIKVRNYLTGR